MTAPIETKIISDKKNVTDSRTVRNIIPIKNTKNKYTIAFFMHQSNLFHEPTKSFAGMLPDHVKSSPD